MSRSFKKSPCCTQQAHRRNVWKDKRQAAKVVRHSKDVPNGKAYKKYFESWDISDYVFRVSFQEWHSENFKRPDLYKFGGTPYTEKELIEGNTLNRWEKWYRRK